MPNLAFDVLWRDRGAERGMKNLGDTTERTHKRFSALKVTAVAALGAAAVGAVKFGGASVRAYVEAETAQSKLQDAYRKFPKLADTQISSLRALNTELAKKTRFDDDATASGQAVLAQFKLTGTQITQLTPLLQDYAAKTGKDLPTAARDLGKAMLGQGRSLKAVGINFKDTGTQGGNFDQIMRSLRTQVGGFATVEGKTAAGQAEILRNQFGELQEAAGAKLLPALLKVGRGLLSVVTYVQDSSGVFGSFRRIATATFSAFTESVGLGRASFRGFADFISTHQADIVSAFVRGGKVVLGFAGVLATMASGGLRALGGLMDGFGTMTSVVIGTLRNLTKGASIAFGWIPGVGAKLKAADRTFEAFAATAVNGFRNAGNGARNAADGIDTKLQPALTKAGRKLDEVARKEIVKAETRDAVNRATIAVRDLGSKADGTQIRLRRFSEITRLSAAEQRAFRTRLDTVSNALRTKMERMRAAGASSADMRREVGRSRDALFREFRQMGLSNAEARRLADRYARVPKKVETKVTQPGMKGSGGAIRQTEVLDRKINDLNSKGVAINFSTNAGRIASSFGVKLSRARAPGTRNIPQGGPGRHSLDSVIGPPVADPEHSHAAGGPTVSRTISTRANQVNMRPVPPAFNRIGDDVALGVGRQLGLVIRKRLQDQVADSATSGAPGGKVPIVAGRGWGAIQAAMRRHGARTFNTYPGHHPTMERARDVYPHNWAAANAARALSGVWYVIYRMKIASKNHGNGWRQYRPTNFRGDWRHVRHIHVARYGTGGMVSRPSIIAAGERGPERILSSQQTKSFDRVSRALSSSGGAVKVENHYHFDRYIGSRDEIRQFLVEANRRNKLAVLAR